MVNPDQNFPQPWELYPEQGPLVNRPEDLLHQIFQYRGPLNEYVDEDSPPTVELLKKRFAMDAVPWPERWSPLVLVNITADARDAILPLATAPAEVHENLRQEPFTVVEHLTSRYRHRKQLLRWRHWFREGELLYREQTVLHDFGDGAR